MTSSFAPGLHPAYPRRPWEFCLHRLKQPGKKLKRDGTPGSEPRLGPGEKERELPDVLKPVAFIHAPH